MKPKVSIIRCRDYDTEAVYDSVKASIDLLGGMERFVRKGERILLKPNLLAGKPPEAAVTTHPSVVRALIRLVREAGATPVVGDSPGMGSAVKIAEKAGVLGACAAEGAEFRELSTLVVAEFPQGHTFKRLEVAMEALEADGIISIPKLKTHAQMFLTLGVKNLFGCVPGKKKPQWHFAAGVDTVHFAGMLLDLHELLSPRLTVMDGIVGMEGNGPASGEPRSLGMVISSADAIAMDTVIAEILGCRPADVPILKAANARGIGTDARGIELLGGGIEDFSVRHFKFPPKMMSLNFAAGLPYFMDRHLRKALTTRPCIDRKACTLCNLCVGVCPPGVMENNGRILIDYDNCIRCYCCQEACPRGAISPKDGWLKKIIPGL